MALRFSFKNTLILILLFIIGSLSYFLYWLAGVSASPVDYAEPPSFVAEYASQFTPSSPSSAALKNNLSEQHKYGKWTRDFYNEAALVRNVILNGESTEQLLQRFTHADKEVRVKIALAFSVVNIMMSHDDGSGYPEKREAFWTATKDYHLDIQNALFEALIVSAEEQTANHIPYTAAWMPINEENKLQILGWAAKHHPDSWVRRFSVYYIAQFGGDEALAALVIKDSIDDPAYRVRKEVFEQYYKKYISL